jgi:hypothetical protein
MITEKDNIKCESVFNDDRTHRLLWRRVWNKDKPMACVIMLNPCHADNIITDTTTALVVNNVARLEKFGGVNILNLFSILTPKLHLRGNVDEEINAPENDDFIKTFAEALKKYPCNFYTCHCTGTESYLKLKEILGNQIQYLSCGMNLTL